MFIKFMLYFLDPNDIVINNITRTENSAVDANNNNEHLDTYGVLEKILIILKIFCILNKYIECTVRKSTNF